MRTLLLSSVAVGVLAFSSGANAIAYSSPTTLSLVSLGTASSSGLQTTVSPQTISGETFTFTSGASPSPTTGIYAGNVTGVAASPFGGSSLEKYFAVEPNGSIQIKFTGLQTAFALLWGSVDTYNSLTFVAGTNTVITGTQVASALGFLPNGLTSKNVLISDLTPFDTLTVLSTTAAFEFVPGTPVPEPMSLAILGAGLVGLGLVRRLRSGDTAV